MQSKSIFVAGHQGLAGSAIVRDLQNHGYRKIATRTRAECDLRDREAVRKAFEEVRPEFVVLAAAKVGGIKANWDFPVEFLLENLEIQNNLIATSYAFGVSKLVFLGSTCIYPKLAEQPLKESALLTGSLEPTNEAYAVAKIAGIKLCQAYAKEYGANFISVMPTNLYGPNDNYDREGSHVLAALIRRVHEAKVTKSPTVTVWGTGTPRREFLHADDLATGIRFLMENYHSPELINIGWGEDISIRELAELICEVLGYRGALTFDSSKPDGTPRKLLDISKIKALGWSPRIGLRDGIRLTYGSFLSSGLAEEEGDRAMK
jgi:GDP-L-fucose synthase